jgi:alkyl sulfatase BDS1-like metallo-beta-lactamase superfamily hydrolase
LFTEGDLKAALGAYADRHGLRDLIVNAAIAAIYQGRGRFREAIRYTDPIISNNPESHLGYTLKADLLCQLASGTESMSESMWLYKKAIERPEGITKRSIEMKSGICAERPARYILRFLRFC